MSPVSSDTTEPPSWQDIFGHPSPYDHQREAITSAREVVDKGGFYVVEAGCGTGKTMTGMTVAGEAIRDTDSPIRRAFVLTSVIQQTKQFVNDIRIINRNLPDDVDPLRTVVLVGKSNVCPYNIEGVHDFTDRNTNGRCNRLRSNTGRAGVYADGGYGKLAQNARLNPASDGSYTRPRFSVNETPTPYGTELPTEYGRDICPFYAHSQWFGEDSTDISFEDAEDYVIDTDTLIRLAAKHGLCPHTAMKALMSYADVVIANYYHAFDFHTLRVTDDLVDASTLLVCDEAHMLEPKVRDILGKSVTLSTMRWARREGAQVLGGTCEDGDYYQQERRGAPPTPTEETMEVFGTHIAAPPMVGAYVRLMDLLEDKVNEIVTGYLNEEFPRWDNLPFDELPTQIEIPLRDPERAEKDRITKWAMQEGCFGAFENDGMAAARAVEAALDAADFDDQAGDYAFPKAMELLNAWEAKDHKSNFRTITLERRFKHGESGWMRKFEAALDVHSCRPGGLIASQLDKFGAGILMSATLAPLDVYRDVVGLDFLNMMKNRPVRTETYMKEFPPENQASFIVDLPKFTYNNRGDVDEWNEVRQAYAHAILSVAQTPGNILICMPSYQEAEWAGNILRESRHCEKPVLLDESSGNDRTEQLKEEFFAGDGKVLLTSLRGTLTEGVDYKGDRLHAVCVCGVPLPNISSPSVRAVRHAFEEEYGGLGFDYSMTVPAVRKVRQALGRVIRGEDDVGVRILVDERYAHNGRGSARKYLGELEQEKYDVVGLDELKSEIQAFWSTRTHPL